MSGLAADGRGRDSDRDEDGADAMGRAIWAAEARRTAADLQADAAAELGEVIHAVKRGCCSYEVRAFHDGVLRLRLLCDGEEMGGGSYPNDPDEVREAMAAGDAYLAAYEDPAEQARPFTLAGSPAEGHWGPDTLPASQAGLVDEASAPEGLNARWTTDPEAIKRGRLLQRTDEFLLHVWHLAGPQEQRGLLQIVQVTAECGMLARALLHHREGKQSASDVYSRAKWLVLRVWQFVRAAGVTVKGVEDFMNDVRDELGRARAKFPSNTLQLAALTEEVGELADTFLVSGDANAVYVEAVQTAAMACRVATEGDSTLPYMPSLGAA